MFNGNFFEQGFDLVPDIIAVDANADITGDYIKVSNYDRAYLLYEKPAGTAGDDPSIQINQASAAAGTGVKALTFNKLWYKKATASGNLFTATPTWTAVTLTSATADLDLVSVNSADLTMDITGTVILVEILTSSLDVNNGFNYVNFFNDGTDIGNALIINTFWLLCGAHYPQATPLTSLS